MFQPPTARLWRKLHHYDESHPLYRKLWHLHYRRALWAPSLDYSHSLTYMAVSVFLSPLFILAPFAVSPLFGTYWAAFIAGMIRFEHQQDRFDLMATLPGGGVSAYDTIATLHMRRTRLYVYLHDALNITGLVSGIGAFLMVSGVIVGLATPQLVSGPEIFSLLGFVVSTLTLLTGFYMDQIQSIMLSYQVGTVVPLHTRGALEARIAGAASYLGIQLTLYGVAGWLGFWLVPRLPFSSTPVSIITATLVLFGLREVTIYGLRRHVIIVLGKPNPEGIS